MNLSDFDLGAEGLLILLGLIFIFGILKEIGNK